MPNQYIQVMCDAIASKLPIEEKNRRAFICIETINKMQSLHEAFVEEMGIEIEEEISLDAADADGRLALHMAVENGCDEIVAELLAQGADPDILDKDNQTPLIRAVKNCRFPEFSPEIKYYEIVNILLENKADIDWVNPKTNESPLTWAVYQQDLKLVQLLLDAGANPNTEERTLRGGSPLEIAAKNDDIEIVTALLNAKIPADPDFCNTATGLTALTIAAERNKDIVELLLEKKANPNPVPGKMYGETPLNRSASYGQAMIFDLLREAGAKVDESVLRHAIYSDRLFMLSFVLLSCLPELDDKGMSQLTTSLPGKGQNNPAILDCIAILSSHPMYKDNFYKSLDVKKYKPEDVKEYLLKLKEVQETFLSYFLLITNNVFSKDIGSLIREYMENYLIFDSPVKAIQYLKPKTVDPQIAEIKRLGQVFSKSSGKIGSGIFQKPPTEEKKDDAMVVSAEHTNKSMWQRVFGL